MTTIAWDGSSLAADKRFTTGNGIFSTIKIERVNGHLIGITGNFALAREMVEWFRAGADPQQFPSAQRDTDKSVGMLVVRPDGSLQKYESGPHPLPIFDTQFAMGSGGDFARAAMHLGKTAAEAIAVAAVFDTATGGGCDTLSLG